MRCRRCSSPNLLALEKRLAEDNLVLRCRECGFLFSPPAHFRTANPGGSQAGAARSRQTGAE